MNVVEGSLDQSDGGPVCRIGAYAMPLPDAFLARRSTLARAIGRTVAVGVRPEAIVTAEGEATGIAGTVVVAEALGSEVLAHVAIDATPVLRDEVREGLSDQLAAIGQREQGQTTIVARLPADTSLRRGDSVTLSLEPEKVHFFDLSDGRAL